MTRTLLPNEFARLAPMIEEMGGEMPSPSNSTVVIEEDDKGEILGVACLQYIIHLEPVWVRKDQRGTGGVVFRRLVGFLKRRFDEVNYLVSLTNLDRVGRLMESYGMVQHPDQKVYVWRRK